ncbi:MAG: 5-formyltetrahydrofolate cyclo-ligase [Sphingobacteriales bacterium]|mgnify:CR=1 FL=1|jgi:5-formyltetrahydrofolate cyclo-ligase|nr:5-formyltetrahydrofolate cyclo-ligase [Sphingobacteriales bacterium]OJW03713.1 MAG: 5-formyltetrahydrofolate cyclo-ligase [Sphingobacteriales bacterium 44-61]
MLKKDARKLYRQKRMGLSIQEMTRMDDLLLIQFQSAGIPFLNTLLSYWPIEENNEPDTHLFTEYLKFRNPELKVCYPVSDFSTLAMQAVVTDIDTPFVKTELNIHEPDSKDILLPEHIDLVFVPLLAVDKQGYRVGYGKGFYDKYLASCKPDCIKAGFSYFEPVDKIDDRHEFDIPLDLVITPHSTYVF